MVESFISIAFYHKDEEIARGYLRRSIAPLTITKIIDNMPIQGRIFFLGNIAYVILDKTFPPENSVRELKEGDIFYWPLGKGFGIALKTHIFRYKVNLLGKITEGLERIAQLKKGSLITIVKTERLSENS
ncbi:MAG: hypothetical protein DRJ38_05730 [Thermoprotei archaeon]|nr:MAG: hypothetical protein DRJ38_05730 [Thermoprotei archaeon]